MYELCWAFSTTQGYLNSFTSPVSSPVAKTALEKDLQTVFTSVKSGPGQIPYTGKPKIEVHVYQSIFLAPEALILC